MTMTANGLAILIEECGELQQVAGKKLACMETDQHWDGGKPLSTRMQDEIADVLAACEFVADTFVLDRQYIHDRKRRKMLRFYRWHADPEA